MKKRRLALFGASGAMGLRLDRLAPEYGFDVIERYDHLHQVPAEKPGQLPEVAIDFTLPEVVIGNVERAVEWNVPIVVGTTGWSDERDRIRELVLAREAKLIWASNFSVGVQLFFRIVRNAASLLNDVPDYDVALHEDHHSRKADSPSGTARSIAEVLLQEIDRKTSMLTETSHGRIDPEQLHVSSRRIGSVIGTHEVLFDSDSDTLELTHRARNRDGFAIGALLAADWLIDADPGFYCFDDIFEQILRDRAGSRTTE